jgi:hypothetical protein
MATLAQPLIALFSGLRRAASRRSGAIPRLASLSLSDHDLADLNLPSELRARVENDRAYEHADRLTFYR